MASHRGRPQNPPPARVARAGTLPQRGKMKPVVHNGKELYQWDQTAKQVFIEIFAPPTNGQVFCNISENYLQLGAQSPRLPTTWYLNHDTWGPVNKEDSYWKNGKETCKIVLSKANPGVHWRFALKDDRDDSRREQQQRQQQISRQLPPGTMRPVQQQRAPVVRQQQQRAPPATSRSPSQGRRKQRPAKEDPPSAPKPTKPIRSALGLREPQQKRQEPSRSASPGHRRARPVSAKASSPVRAKSTSSLLSHSKSQQKPAATATTRDPSPGRPKSALVTNRSNRPTPVKAKSVTVVSPDRDQEKPRQIRNAQPSRSVSPSPERPRSGKENVPSSGKDKLTSSFLDRFQASKEAQQQNASDLPVTATKPTVSFMSPPTKNDLKAQQKNESKPSRAPLSARRNVEQTKSDHPIPAKTAPSASRSPLTAISQHPQNDLEEKRPRSKSQQYSARPKSASPERRRAARATKTDPPSKARSSKQVPAHTSDHKKKPTTKLNEKPTNSKKTTGPIVQRPSEIRSVGRGKSKSFSDTSEKKVSPAELVYMHKLRSELESREQEIHKLNRKIDKLEDIIAAHRHHHHSRKRRNKDMTHTVDDLEDQLKQSKSEHKRELSKLEKANRRMTAELDRQTALVQDMEKELAKTQTRMEKTRRLSIAQDREIVDRESRIGSLQSQLQKSKRRGDTHEQDQIMDELQKQIHRVKNMKKGMKEYKRRWKEQRQFSDMQTKQIMDKQSFVNSLTAKLETANRRVLELEHELKQDQVEIVAAAKVLTDSHKYLEQLQGEHKQALKKIQRMESELRQQWQQWNDVEQDIAGVQAWMPQLLKDFRHSDRYHESLAREAIKEMIESRPDGKGQRRIDPLQSELEEQQHHWNELEEVLDLAQTKVASLEQQWRPKKLSDYIMPDYPLASVNEDLDRLAVKAVGARNQLEEAHRRLPTSQRPANMVLAK